MQNNITKKIVGTALFSALAFVVSFLEFPIFPAADFLKIDFSAVFIALSSFLFGPIFGVITIAVKELLKFLTSSSTGGIGELANFLVAFSFIIIPSVVYVFKKKLVIVIITLIIGILTATVTALISNRFIMFPLYMGGGAKSVFNSLWYFILFFNLIKWTAVSVLTVLFYKRLSVLYKKI